MKKLKKIVDIKDRNILIDTNIIIRCARKDSCAEDFKKMLRLLVNNGNKLAASAMSGFEIIKKFKEDEEVLEYSVKLLDYIDTVDVSREILVKAGMMANKLYSNKNNYRKDNDIIIGATAVNFSDVLLLTYDKKGFSEPY